MQRLQRGPPGTGLLPRVDPKFARLHKRQRGGQSVPLYLVLLGAALLLASGAFVASGLLGRLPASGAAKGGSGSRHQPIVSTGGGGHVPGTRQRQQQQQGTWLGGDGDTGADRRHVEGGAGGQPVLHGSQQHEGEQQQPQPRAQGVGGHTHTHTQPGKALDRRAPEFQLSGKQQLEQQQRHQAIQEMLKRSQQGQQQQQQQQQQAKGGAQPNLALQRDIEALIEEAETVARDHGVVTDTATVLEQRGIIQVVDDEDDADSGADGGTAAAAAADRCSPQDCAPHGVCDEGSGRCACVVLYSGRHCGHGLYLSWPFLPDAMAGFKAGYVGELLLSRAGQHTQLQVTLPWLPATQQPRLVADAATTQQLQQLLPGGDGVLKGKGFARCAVVGSSGSLLLGSAGAAIDSHSLVLRLNDAPTAGYEEHVGSRTHLRITALRAWGWREGQEVALVHTQSPRVLEGLAWAAEQGRGASVLALDPGFEDYAAASFAFRPHTGLYGLLLALHACRSVTLYGFSQGRAQGVPHRYYDACAASSDASRDTQQWQVVKALTEAGLVQLGEPCVPECMAGDDAACSSCREKQGLDTAAAAAAMACDPAKQPWRYQVPWLKNGSADGE